VRLIYSGNFDARLPGVAVYRDIAEYEVVYSVSKSLKFHLCSICATENATGVSRIHLMGQLRGICPSSCAPAYAAIGIASATILRGRRLQHDPGCVLGTVRRCSVGTPAWSEALTRWGDARLSDPPTRVGVRHFPTRQNGRRPTGFRPRKARRVVSARNPCAGARLLSKRSSTYSSPRRVIQQHASCDFPADYWCHVTGGSHGFEGADYPKFAYVEEKTRASNALLQWPAITFRRRSARAIDTGFCLQGRNDSTWTESGRRPEPDLRWIVYAAPRRQQ